MEASDETVAGLLLNVRDRIRLVLFISGTNVFKDSIMH